VDASRHGAGARLQEENLAVGTDDEASHIVPNRHYLLARVGVSSRKVLRIARSLSGLRVT
jgi:hypothetical protein